MMTAFQHVDANNPNGDLDVHPNPYGLWARTAVCCLWQDAKIARKRWPDASVIGPLRTMRGIDTLVRSLLANPQIRCVIIDGPDLTHDVVETLYCVWRAEERATMAPIGADVPYAAFAEMADGVRLVSSQLSGLREGTPDTDRPGGAIFLPPPKAVDAELWPHGDPGQRVVGDTLADVWPRALEQAMRFGRVAPTHYGETREVLALSSVIRKPAWICAMGPEKHSVLGINKNEVLAYYRQLVGVDPPGAREYSYGSRMQSAIAKGQGRSMDEMEPGSNGRSEAALMALVPPPIPDQIAAVRAQMAASPVDAGKESGRPCLVGVWFRAIDRHLHMVVAFRSHDLYAGYVLNLAACCEWLCREAANLGLFVGALTCHSYSAHVYARDYTAAEEVVKANPAPMLDWDQRSNWRVWTRLGLDESDEQLYFFAEAMNPSSGAVIASFDARSASALRLAIARSGLVTSIGAALWLGSEIEKQ